MSDSRKRSLDQILDQAQTLGPDKQLEFIRDACARDEVDYVDHESLQYSRQLDAEGVPQQINDSTNPAAAGEVIGAYRIIRSLGQGGMGEVFLAERADRQFEQLVAIKLVKRGLLSRHVQGRLRQERQILATLNHPNIARLYDGGTTADGTPYIVMEYVDGQPLDIFCDTHALTIDERLRLFITVCSAVQRAHQNLIVHRDLKPSNILVTAAGVPKLLDFGIAKLLDERQTMHTMAVTQVDVRVMTPDHASPEQIRGDLITTTSDIYVLGVLLYELLCGYKPFILEGNRLAELERAICEDTPPTLSAAIAAAEGSAPTAAAQIAAERSVSVAKLRRDLRGDLDNIALMAMRKEPERRYSSVEQLALDIERYLAGMPVAARTDAWSYRARKFVGRHTVSVAFSIALATLLLAFTITTYLQSQSVRQERDLAQSERVHAEEVTAFLVDSFTLADPARARGKEITAREILDAGAARIAKGLNEQPAQQARLLDTIGLVYMRLSQLAEAEPFMARALDVRRSQAPNGSIEVARSLNNMAVLYENKAELNRADALARDSLAMARKFGGEKSVDVARSLCRLGVIARKRGDFTSASRILDECGQSLASLKVVDNDLATLHLDNLARIAMDRSDYATAENLIAKVLVLDRATLGEDHPQYIRHLTMLAITTGKRGDITAADALFKQVSELCERVFGKDARDTLSTMIDRATFLTSTRRFDQAEDLFRYLVPATRKTYGPTHTVVGNTLERLGRLEFGQHQLVEAEVHFREALAIFKQSLGPGNGYTASTLTMLGRTQLELNRPKEAEATLRESLESWRLEMGEHSIGYAVAQSALGRALAQQRRFAGAEEAFIASYPTIAKEKAGSGLELQGTVKGWVEDLYRDMGRPEAAQRFFSHVAALE